jgi:forkhead box protein J2/3
VDDNVDPRTGVHRVRNKKGKKGKEKAPDTAPEFEAADQFEGPQADVFNDQPAFVPQAMETDPTQQPTFVPSPAYPPTYVTFI